ncbi:MAG: MFS transporter [Ignavibacteria bacterium]|nr:MFS transporter [Ignavibacteria bacterium]
MAFGPFKRLDWQADRNLYVLWFAQFVAMIGMSACIPFLPLFVIELGVAKSDAPLWSGLITAAPFVFSSLLTPLWGALGDRYGQKLMVVRAILGLGIAMTLMGLSTNVWMLLSLRIFQGAASGFVASNNAFISAQTPAVRVGFALATLQTSISAGNILGPLVGGTISDALGFRSVFWFVGAMCLISMFIVMRYVHEDKGLSSPRSSRVGKNITMAFNNKHIRTLLITLFIAQSAIVLTTPIFPYYLEQLGAPKELLSTLTGMIVSIVGVCVIISAPWWGRRSDRVGYTNTVKIAAAVVSIGMLLQVFVPSFYYLFPLRIIIGLSVGAILPLSYAELARRAPDGRKGGIMGLASSATLLGNLTGPLICAAIATNLPLEYTFVASALLMALVIAFTKYSEAKNVTAISV